MKFKNFNRKLDGHWKFTHIDLMDSERLDYYQTLTKLSTYYL